MFVKKDGQVHHAYSVEAAAVPIAKGDPRHIDLFTPVWNLFDGLGSVLGTVDSSGVVVSSRKYDVYGSVRSSTGPSGSKHKFCGALGHPSEDAVGLVYMRARWMDPATGRFVSQDPSGSRKNWFVYASSNPVNAVRRFGTPM